MPATHSQHESGTYRTRAKLLGGMLLRPSNYGCWGINDGHWTHPMAASRTMPMHRHCIWVHKSSPGTPVRIYVLFNLYGKTPCPDRFF